MVSIESMPVENVIGIIKRFILRFNLISGIYSFELGCCHGLEIGLVKLRLRSLYCNYFDSY